MSIVWWNPIFNVRTSCDVFKTKTRRKPVDEIGPRSLQIIENLHIWKQDRYHLSNYGGGYVLFLIICVFCNKRSFLLSQHQNLGWEYSFWFLFSGCGWYCLLPLDEDFKGNINDIYLTPNEKRLLNWFSKVYWAKLPNRHSICSHIS